MAILLRFDVFQQISDTNIASCLKTIKMPLYKVPLRQCLSKLYRTELKLSDVEIQKLLDPRFVPQWNRDTIFRPADICKMRNCLESLKLDSVMACYRTCLQFHDRQLAKGVFMQAKAFKVDDSQQFLWFALAPDEIAAVVHHGFASLSNEEAYRLRGNMLVPVHSAFQWLRIAQTWTAVMSKDRRLPQLDACCQELATLCSQAILIHKDAEELIIPVTLSATLPFIVWRLVEFPQLRCQVFSCVPTSSEIQDSCDRILHVWNEEGTSLSTHFLRQALKHVCLIFWHGGMAICPADVTFHFALDSLQQCVSWSERHSIHLQLDLHTVAIACVMDGDPRQGTSFNAPLTHVQLCQNLRSTQMVLGGTDASIFYLADSAIVCAFDDADFVKCANCLRDFEATALSALFGCTLQVRIPVFEDDRVGAALLPSRTGFGMDSADTAILVNARYFTSFLDVHSLPVSQCEAVFAYIDFDGFLLWKGFISPQQTLQTIVDAWLFANNVISIAPTCRIVIAGRQASPEYAIGDFIVSQTSSVKIHLRYSLHGGGPSETSVDKVLEARRGVASFLQEHGAQSDEAMEWSQNVIDALGFDRFRKSTLLSDEIQLAKALLGMSSAASIKMPPGLALPQFQRKRQRPISASQLQLDLAQFSSSDGTELALLFEISAQSPPGIALLDPQQARHFLTCTHLVDHELLMCVLGRCPATDNQHCNSMSIPAKTVSGETVVVAVCAHQLGKKNVKFEKDEQRAIALPSSSIWLFRVFRDEFADQQWDAFISQPIRSALGRFHKKQPLLAPPWGRSWCSPGRKRVTPQEAQMFAFAGRVLDEDVASLLAQSGHNSVYMSPLHDDSKGLNQNAFRVIWLNQPKSQMAPIALKMNSQLGIVKTPKGHFGIRVGKNQFEAAWKHLRPSEPLPPDDTGHRTWKIENCPPGTTSSVIITWLGHHNWQARPTRQLSASTWLVTSSKDPPATTIPLNNHYVLIKEVVRNFQRSGGNQVLRAGEMPVDIKTTLPDQKVDPLQIFDPWMSTSKAISSSSSVNDNVRLAQNEKQIHELKSHFEQLQQQQQIDAKENAKFRQDCTKEFADVRQQLTGEIQQLHGTFQSSLETAVSKQEARMTSEFSDLKKLLQNLGAGQRPSKRPADVAHTSDMSD